MLNTNRQTGFGLLELLLVFVIAALILIMGIRLYEKQEMQQQINEAKQTAQLLLHAADNYYYANCTQDLDDKNGAQYKNAKAKLDHPVITVASLQQDQLLENNSHIFFHFGTFTDGEMYHITLGEIPYNTNQCINASENQEDTAQNCFAQQTLWQVQVSACVTAFTIKKTDPKNPDKPPTYTLPDITVIKSMFGADEATPTGFLGATCQNGIIVTWESIPRIQQTAFGDQGDALLSADQREFNQMYRYGPWMQQGPLAEGTTNLKERLEYLCQ